MSVGTLYTPQPLSELDWITQEFDGKLVDCLAVDVSGHDYELCEEASCKFWANEKPGVYGAGLGRTDDDPRKPVRVGLLGQMAFAKIFADKVDLVYRKGGDSYDNRIGGKKFDVKCAMKNYGVNLILHTTERGHRQRLNKDIYVCSYIESEDREARIAEVMFVGFATPKGIAKCEVLPGRKGAGHLNYEVPFSKMYPMAKLMGWKPYFDDRAAVFPSIEQFMRKYAINIHEVQQFVGCPVAKDKRHVNRKIGASTICNLCGEWNADGDVLEKPEPPKVNVDDLLSGFDEG